MRTRTKIVIGAGVVLAMAGVATGVSVATGSDDDIPLVGEELDRASEAALAHVGEGTVIETEAGEGDAVYEVGVELPDGSVVEVDLDEAFTVIDSAVEDESGNGSNESGETTDDGGATDS
ncbi:MAG: PepSY domain-containing protein [Actinomycetota bacterium]